MQNHQHPIENNVLELFHPLVNQWFQEKVGSPTDIQTKAWPAIASGNHVLVTAPTGSGKTLTAFLWAINLLLTHPESRGQIRILYVSPLKALNNDIQRNLQQPLQQLETYFNSAGQPFPQIRTAVRSGDTEPGERRLVQRHPPEIFITTPESLNVLLSSKSGQHLLTGIQTVILDEIHAVFSVKRGSYLITAIERLVPLCGEFQRIALSATINPLETVANFVAGFRLTDKKNPSYEKRPISIIRSHIQKTYHIRVEFPETTPGINNTDSWWPALTQSFVKTIQKNHSTLFFANSRRMVEKITRMINDSSNELVYSHHGSLSKEIRSIVEKRFKDGELSAIIATSSLELGIDIGSVDQVVLIQSPYSISSAIQRVGRSGHGVGQQSRGVFFPIHPRDLVESAVTAANIQNQSVESMKPIESPLDVLAQVLLSMTINEEQNIDHLFAEIRCAYPFHHLNRTEFNLVIHMLAGRYADSRIRELKPRLLLDRVKNTAKARENTHILLFLSGGVIPDRGYFIMRDAETKAKIAELDEEFVWERSLGDAFPLGNQIWRIQRITANDVEVSRVTKSNTLIPFWRAEDLNRSFHLSDKIGRFLEMAEINLHTNPDILLPTLTNHYHLSQPAALALIDYLKQQRAETKAPLPHRHHILIEHFRDPINHSDAKQTVLHTLWGGKLNRPFALALAAAWEEKYHYPLQIFANNDCIMLNLPHTFQTADLITLVKPNHLLQLLRSKMESTGYFGARFRENAQRALLLPRQGFNQRMPLWLNRLRSKKLLDAVSQYKDFPVLLETWRNCLNHDFEIDSLLDILDEIASGQITFTEVVTKQPSPFAENIMWRQTNQYMYQDDSPQPKLKTNLDDSLLKEILASSHLRPRFSRELLHSFQEKLQRTACGYAPDSPDELLLFIKERIFIPGPEWKTLLAATEKDHGLDTEKLTGEITDRVYWITGKNKNQPGIIALENLPLVSRALQLTDTQEDAQKVEKLLTRDDQALPADDDEVFIDFLQHWLHFYGPITANDISTLLGVPPTRLAMALDALRQEGEITIDFFREPPDHEQEEICDNQNLEILLRLRRTQARPALEPLDIDSLPLFLATYQRLTPGGEGLEDLQNSLENLFGYPAKASLWESDILPARLQPYYSSWLDTALRDNALVWFGCGNERIGFCFQPDYDLFASEAGVVNETDQEFSSKTPDEDEAALYEAVEKLDHFFSASLGQYSLSDLMEYSGVSSILLTRALWKLVWQGRISNDHFKTVRSGILNRFQPGEMADSSLERQTHTPVRGHRRLNFNRWQATRAFSGHWFILPKTGAGESDALDRQEIIKDRIRLLFMRYGILFREILWNELPPLRWREIFPVLRLMELSGEIVSGHFFKGIPGLQFATPRVLGLLSRGLPHDAVYWMNAMDPASPCGINLETLKPLLPHRLPSTHLVFHGKTLILVSRKNGKELSIYVEPNHPRLPGYLEFFKVLVSREFQPLKYISVETINDQPILESPYKEALKSFGFHKDYKAMTLVKQY